MKKIKLQVDHSFQSILTKADQQTKELAQENTELRATNEQKDRSIS